MIPDLPSSMGIWESDDRCLSHGCVVGEPDGPCAGAKRMGGGSHASVGHTADARDLGWCLRCSTQGRWARSSSRSWVLRRIRTQMIGLGDVRQLRWERGDDAERGGGHDSP